MFMSECFGLFENIVGVMRCVVGMICFRIKLNYHMNKSFYSLFDFGRLNARFR